MHARAARRHRVGLLLLVLVFGAAAPAAAAGEYRTVEVASLKVTIDAEWASKTTPGYVPIRFDITNLGEARVIALEGEGMRYFWGRRVGSGARVAVRRTVRLARGDRVRLTIPVPVMAENENIQFRLVEEGRTLEVFGYSGGQSRSAPDAASVLIVADPNGAFVKAAANWPRTITGPSGGLTISAASGRGAPSTPMAPPPVDFLLAPERLPANWLGYTSLRAVAIGPTEWEQLNGAQKEALLTWTACGGDLLFVDGTLDALFAGGQGAPVMPPGAPARAYFLGRIHLPSSAAINSSGLGTAIAAATALQDANWALPANRARDWGVIAARGFRLPIPGIEGIPARAYLSILVVFSILIGPANYWFFWRMRRQVLLVLTAPIISALFIVLLAAYVLGGEGLGVRGRAVTFTMLDEARRQAVTRASMSLYAAGRTPAGGLRFSPDVAVFPIGAEGTGSREPLALDLTDEQRFTSGAIRARAPANLEQVTFRSARERLTFSAQSGGVSVVNGLGASVAMLLYRQNGTVYHLADALPSGGRGLLVSGAPGSVPVVPATFPQSPRFQHLLDHQPEGSYLAVLDSSPFWEPGLPGVVERGSFHLVLGWPMGQP